jgi:hypothetical protein
MSKPNKLFFFFFNTNRTPLHPTGVKGKVIIIVFLSTEKNQFQSSSEQHPIDISKKKKIISGTLLCTTKCGCLIKVNK